ncbi:hypothetical protein FVE85_9273 [Porphyridium purpureum]|uniref:Transcription factor Pcc1 n=1 Tax=Porphyridium purpureum TaxID=35688 RepID=A0A5J4YNB1_PORPP|nr:hypothetical protein FVE85_9273 [Porphyridium purpureum]|eukprot:POR3771..scf222_8
MATAGAHAGAPKHRYLMEVPFPDARLAEIIVRVMNVDEELRPEVIERVVERRDSVVIIRLESSDLKSLRTAVNSFYDYFLVSVHAMREFRETGTSASSATAAQAHAQQENIGAEH